MTSDRVPFFFLPSPFALGLRVVVFCLGIWSVHVRERVHGTQWADAGMKVRGSIAMNVCDEAVFGGARASK